MKFTIDRSKWRCGDCGPYAAGAGDTLLLNDQGFMCCLGQIELLLGRNTDVLHNSGEPSELPALRGDPAADFLQGYDRGKHNSPLAAKAMAINDDGRLAHNEKEQRLTSLFAEHGHELEFVGEFTYFTGEAVAYDQ